MYGLNTRSYNRSTEAREMKRQQAEATAKFVANPDSVEIRWTLCRCLSFRLPHDPREHRKLRSDLDWRPWQERANSIQYYEGVK